MDTHFGYKALLGRCLKLIFCFLANHPKEPFINVGLERYGIYYNFTTYTL